MPSSEDWAPAGVRDVAVIGLGQTGRGIARNLDAAGRLAAAWDCSPEAIERAALSSAVARTGPATLGGAKAVLLVVPGSAQIRAMLGDGGLLQTPHEGQVLIDLTTSDPSATREIAEAARATGRAYLDCGMTGGARAADACTITLMVDGDGAVVEACRPILSAFAAKVFHVGDSGAGHAMKLVYNMICHTIFLATSEGCRLAEKLGIPLKTAVAVINAGNARSFVSEQRFPNHIIPGTFDGRSRTANLAKDLAMAAKPGARGGRTGRLRHACGRPPGAGHAGGPGRAGFHQALSASDPAHASRRA